MTPRATQRLQFHKDFTFADAEAIVPYLAKLGISHLYASPIAAARKGSMHGYDVIDPTRINPELGGEDDFRRLVAALKQYGMGLVVDIVPNHMAASPENAWWMDVLAHGRTSRYARSFDIDWQPDERVFLPWLTSPLAEAKATGELDKLDLPQPGSYRLAWWRTANDRINWRRFFDINDLVCLRMEDHETFERVHALTFRLLAEGLIDGVRIDHVDGLADPAGYCRKLRQRLGDAYFVVEKILLAGEVLPPAWGCEGTTGYDFMDEVNAVQHDPAAAEPLAAAWAAITGRPSDFAIEEEAARREILSRSFGAQLNACIAAFVRYAPTEDLSEPAIRRALTELLAHFPVYRTYASAEERPAADKDFLSIALEGAQKTALPGDRWVLDLLACWFSDPGLSAEPLRRFQQLSAPIAAKSVEDTGFYRFGRLLSRNDVGFDPRRFASTPVDFHRMMQARRETAPHAMLATATHDHKRGEDVRARLAVLSEQPEIWVRHLKDWISRSPSFLDPADLAMLFQSIVGAWPLDLAFDDKAGRADFSRRLIGWQEKALREAKLRSDWSDPNQAYESAARDFVLHLVADDQSALLTDVFAFVEKVAVAGAVNALAQVALKLTVPGMPDFYQGTEFWDFSLVDPDNRRPVNFDARRKSLDMSVLPDALSSWRDGRVKQLLIHQLLGLRLAKPELFALGSYEPVDAGQNVIAFRRHLGDDTVSVAVPRLPWGLMADSTKLAVTKSAGFCLWSGPELFEERLPLSIFSTFAPRFSV